MHMLQMSPNLALNPMLMVVTMAMTFFDLTNLCCTVASSGHVPKRPLSELSQKKPT